MRRLAALLLAAGCSAAPAGAPPAEQFRAGAPSLETGVVERITDGDTFRLEGGERVRLIGVDTPETVAPGKDVECFGPEATAELAKLIPPGSRVRLLRDRSDRDRFDRLLRYVTADDGTDVQLALLDGGFAEAKRYKPDTARADEFEQAEQAARAAGAGRWSRC